MRGACERAAATALAAKAMSEFEQKLQQLTELGFDAQTARTALRRACGDLEVAASRLLGESETPAEAPPPEMTDWRRSPIGVPEAAAWT